MSLEVNAVSEQPEASKVAAYAARLGEDELASRLATEKCLRDSRGKVEARGLFKLEQFCNLYSMIGLCMKVTGFWGRAHRNYFDIVVEENEVVLDRLPKAFDGYRILQVTDLHADLHPDFPEAVKRVIAPLDFDLVLMTGDFRTCTFSDHSGATAAAIDILAGLEPSCVGVLGNHDSIEKVPALEEAGIQMLLNEHTYLEREGERLYLVGIDDPNFYKTHNFERALTGVPETSFKLLLSHSPETYKEANALGFDFCLSGHTHGGQICLPGGIVVVHDGSSPRHLLAGPWREGNLKGYTGRGTGATGLPVRLNCPAEVTIHTLHCAR
ncbi:MAG: metallophosphoesterase [Verrucomicrobiota bacterium]